MSCRKLIWTICLLLALGWLALPAGAVSAAPLAQIEGQRNTVSTPTVASAGALTPQEPTLDLAPLASSAVAAAAPACGIDQIALSPDLTGDGLGDVLAKWSNGHLYLHPMLPSGQLAPAVYLGAG